MSRQTYSMTIVLIRIIRNHNKNTSVHYRRLALQPNRAMYIAAFVFGHDVDSYFPGTLENAADKWTRQYMYVHSVLQVRRTRTLIDLE